MVPALAFFVSNRSVMLRHTVEDRPTRPDSRAPLPCSSSSASCRRGAGPASETALKNAALAWDRGDYVAALTTYIRSCSRRLTPTASWDQSHCTASCIGRPSSRSTAPRRNSHRVGSTPPMRQAREGRALPMWCRSRTGRMKPPWRCAPLRISPAMVPSSHQTARRSPISKLHRRRSSTRRPPLSVAHQLRSVRCAARCSTIGSRPRRRSRCATWRADARRRSPSRTWRKRRW